MLTKYLSIATISLLTVSARVAKDPFLKIRQTPANIPDCSTGCFQNVLNSPSCSPGDYTCYCSTQQIIWDLDGCIQAMCPPDQAGTAIAVGQGICGGVAAGISSTEGTAPTTTTIATGSLSTGDVVSATGSDSLVVAFSTTTTGTGAATASGDLASVASSFAGSLSASGASVASSVASAQSSAVASASVAVSSAVASLSSVVGSASFALSSAQSSASSALSASSASAASAASSKASASASASGTPSGADKTVLFSLGGLIGGLVVALL